jgi:hypothetical protein
MHRRALLTRVVGAAALAFTVAACASTMQGPRIMTVHTVRAQPVVRGEWIDSYDTAVVSVATMMRDALGLPEVQADIVFFPDRNAFRAGLEADGYTADAARLTAETLTAVSGYRRVLVNEDGLRDASWPIRIALLAHEMAHTLQYEWAGGVRGTSDQWVREGFAEWVEVQALTRFGFTTPTRARATVAGRIRDAGGARAFPPLSKMTTFPEWVTLAGQFDQEAFYGYAWMATELLIERHGVDKLIAYFQLFGRSQDRLENFKRAFGHDVRDFEAAFDAAQRR